MNDTLTDEATCRICKTGTPREGRTVCDKCLGFEGPTETIPPNPNLCCDCGSKIEPYKIGRNTITSGRCRECNQKLKYGPDWIPGGRSKSKEKQREYAKQYNDKKRSARDKGNDKNQVSTPDENAIITLTIPFTGGDETMFRKLQAVAARERRSPEQQLLYYLDGIEELLKQQEG